MNARKIFLSTITIASLGASVLSFSMQVEHQQMPFDSFQDQEKSERQELKVGGENKINFINDLVKEKKEEDKREQEVEQELKNKDLEIEKKEENIEKESRKLNGCGICILMTGIVAVGFGAPILYALGLISK